MSKRTIKGKRQHRVGGRGGLGLLCSAALVGMLTTSALGGLINLELRAPTPTVAVGEMVDVELWFVPDGGEPQTWILADIFLEWDPALNLVSYTNAIPLISNTFPTIPPGPHRVLWSASPIPAPATIDPGGTLITTFRFQALSTTPAAQIVFLMGDDAGPIFVADETGCNVIGKLDGTEVTVVESSDAALIGSFPPHMRSLCRTANNFIRLTFNDDITEPADGELLIEVMNSNGAYGTSYTIGPDGSTDFQVEVVNDGGGDPRILEIWENGSVLTHATWIAVHNVGGWSGVADFHRHYTVLMGDVNGDGNVLPTDFGPMFPKIPTFGADADERADVNGDGDVLPTDFGPMFPYIPTLESPKPSGHLP